MDAIVTYDLSKQYEAVTALAGLNLQISEGAAFACVGRKGAGKTTLIRLLSGLCRPTEGECSVLGFSPYFEADRLHAMTGTVLDSAQLYREMTLSENLRFFGGLNGEDENDILDRSSFLLHGLDIWEGRDTPLVDLPTGVVFRASVARALIHHPRLLLLDEPAERLDNETSESIRAVLSGLVEQEGMTLLLATENMEFAQRLCDSFGLFRQGTLLARGDLETLRRGAGVRYRALLRIGQGQEPPRGFQPAEDEYWGKEIASEEELSRITAQVVREGNALYEARLLRPTLEEIYDAVLIGGLQRAGEDDEQESDDGETDETEVHPDGPADGDGGEEA